jgi:hypothetical protein
MTNLSAQAVAVMSVRGDPVTTVFPPAMNVRTSVKDWITLILITGFITTEWQALTTIWMDLSFSKTFCKRAQRKKGFRPPHSRKLRCDVENPFRVKLDMSKILYTRISYSTTQN